MFSSSEYTKAIDIWSCGCILAELLGRTPIFRGQHFLDQIERIIAIIGTPKQEDLCYKIDEKTQKYLDSLPQRDSISLDILYPNANPMALDLLKKMLMYNPQKR
jgi:mitogen-activated protein kinase 1/3